MDSPPKSLGEPGPSSSRAVTVVPTAARRDALLRSEPGAVAFGFSIWTRAQLLARLLPTLGRELIAADIAELALLERETAPPGCVVRRGRLAAAGIGPRVLGALASHDPQLGRLYAIDQSIEGMLDDLGAIDPAGARQGVAAPRTKQGPVVDGMLLVEDGLTLGADSWAMFSRLERAGQTLEVRMESVSCPALPTAEAWIEPLTSLAHRLRERCGSAHTGFEATTLDAGMVTTWLAPNEQAEVRHAAATAVEWLANGRVSAEDICVVAPSARHGAVVRALRRRGVEAWAPATARDSLAGRLLLASLDAAGQRWPRAALASFVQILDVGAGKAMLADLHAVGSTDDRGLGHRRRLESSALADSVISAASSTAWLARTLDLWPGSAQPLAAWLSHARQALRILADAVDPRDWRGRAIATVASSIDGRLEQAQRHALPDGPPIELERFSAALAAVLAATSVPNRPLGAAVRVVDVDWVAQDCTHVIALGLSEGGLVRPTGGTIAGLADGPRRRLERAVGGRLTARRGLDVLRLLRAAAGAERVIFSRAQRDGQGAAQDPNPVWLALAEVGPGPRVLDHGHDLTDDGRMALLALAQRPRARLGEPTVRLSVEATATVRARLGLAPAARSPVAWTTSASAIESYARCPFRFFASRVLGLDEPESYEDELDARESGSLRHAVMAAVFSSLGEAGLLPLRGAEHGSDERSVALEAARGALAEHAGANRVGPTGLWRLETALIERDLLRVLETERAVASGWTPRFFEREFAASEIALPGGTRVVRLRGRIDRVDVRGEGGQREAMVLDYKSGSVAGKLSAQQIGRTQFQLPLYARTIRGELSASAVDAALVSLRDGRRPQTTMLGLKREHPQVAMMLDGTHHDPPLPAIGGRDLIDTDVTLDGAVWSLVLGVESGRFDVAPFDPKTTCRGCGFQALCLIAEQREGVEGGEGEP